jgi:hypothetical protein
MCEEKMRKSEKNESRPAAQDEDGGGLVENVGAVFPPVCGTVSAKRSRTQRERGVVVQ